MAETIGLLQQTGPEQHAGTNGVPARKITVVYLAGTGRTGSTLVERILETYQGVCSVGEIGQLWHFIHRLKRDLSTIACPCGASIADCENWTAIMRAAALTQQDLEKLTALQLRTYGRLSRFLSCLFPLASHRAKEEQRRLVELTERIYLAAAEVHRADVVIDASNFPFGALLAHKMTRIELRVKHLVRSPEGVAFSWREPKYHAGLDVFSSRFSTLRALKSWLGSNVMVEMLRFVMPVRRYRYEWFVRDPRVNVAKMMADVPGFDSSSNGGFLNDRELEFEAGHAILGNPDRFRSGRTVIRMDERHKTGLPWRDRALITALTFPFKLYYGYIGPKSADESEVEAMAGK